MGRYKDILNIIGRFVYKTTKNSFSLFGKTKICSEDEITFYYFLILVK